MKRQPTVHPGQTWADNDPRSEGRTLRVDAVDDGRAVCTVLTDVGGTPAPPRKPSLIRLGRFRATSTGYRLVQDAP